MMRVIRSWVFWFVATCSFRVLEIVKFFFERVEGNWRNLDLFSYRGRKRWVTVCPRL